MRVCLVSREVAPFYGAGIAAYVASMARAWADSGCEVHVLTEPHAGIDRPGPWFTGVRFHAVPQPLVRSACAPGAPGFLRYSTAAAMVLRDLHARTPFDLIEFPEYWAEGLMALREHRGGHPFAGATLVLRLHTPTDLCRRLNEEPLDSDDIPALVSAEYEAMTLADALVSPTRALLDEVLPRLGPAAPPARVIPYPFYPPHARGGGGATSGEVLYFGRLERRKGVDLLLDAVVSLMRAGERVTLRCIGGDTRTAPGGGSMRAWLAGRVPAELADRVRFEPPVPREALAGAIARASVCCFPSRWENFPNACLEAMAMGACVVGSSRGGMAEIIEHGRSGLLASPEPEALADALRSALRDPALRAEVARNAPARVARLCEPAAVAQRMRSLAADPRAHAPA